ncbi:hypothetical protein O7602_05925 [Micromonospora sp. WMMD1128]|uniref:hypothetical protein n=1 Tax=unclassified Micromonospora TaxID=2617518 RepID=UPI00248C717E|nr:MULTISPECIES: hypothetical protein [unclassified Micromonospora]WBB75065.1 hypothetical protein O7602_05925 [Micromonospora sp. WMMD1128]WFE31560.1 hypothetical protein O7613_18265 [Micromonospora sp. WMMD975]
MAAVAAGRFRRTPLERSDQRVSWRRTDQAFFAAGACHILAWVCRDTYPDRAIEMAGVRYSDDPQVFHVYAFWAGWAFDHSGWNPEPDLLASNQDFERRPLDRVAIGDDLAAFCRAHLSRMPHQYWQDPLPRARDYVRRYPPPWA